MPHGRMTEEFFKSQEGARAKQQRPPRPSPEQIRERTQLVTRRYLDEDDLESIGKEIASLVMPLIKELKDRIRCARISPTHRCQIRWRLASR